MEKKRFVLMSLREKPWRKIVSGEKRYEFRTRYPEAETMAFVYVTRAVKKLCGIILFDRPVAGTAEEISAISERENPGSYEAMMEYFFKGKGYAIPVRRVMEFAPVSLEEIREKFPDFVVPQSYYYLDVEGKERLLEFFMKKSQCAG